MYCFELAGVLVLKVAAAFWVLERSPLVWLFVLLLPAERWAARFWAMVTFSRAGSSVRVMPNVWINWSFAAVKIWRNWRPVEGAITV